MSPSPEPARQTDACPPSGRSNPVPGGILVRRLRLSPADITADHQAARQGDGGHTPAAVGASARTDTAPGDIGRLLAAVAHIAADAGRLPAASALAVLAHPDDESFGLGAVLCSLLDAGLDVAGLCFTHGEASTLGAAGADLRKIRAQELAEAATALGIGDVELLDYPDGHLSNTPIAELASQVIDAARRQHADLLLVFDEEGVTGHPDHQQATRAAMAAAHRLDLAVLAWAVPEPVAAALNEQFATHFVGRATAQIDLNLSVDRTRQLAAIACHRSQSGSNPVLWRRLELTGSRESLHWLRPERDQGGAEATRPQN